jgi:1,2-diacylglycerol 3-beta-galactosyltransferase|tara:strand:+ start:6562 stop:6873 length:312 start_codon:yes stop_codon:yes gene_type:complete
MNILSTGYIPCQEEGNVSYVLDNGVGAYSEDPAEIANIVARWFETPNYDLKTMSAKAKLLGRPEATFDIVRGLTGLIIIFVAFSFLSQMSDPCFKPSLEMLRG